MRSVMSHTFSQVPKAKIQRSSFDRSHGYKTTFDAGYLVPVFVDEALPGDTFNLQLTAFSRLATPIFPIMDNLHMDTHFFAVPLRLLWENFERFNGAQDNPDDSTDFLIPEIDSVSGYANGSLSDYFGLPTQVPNIKHSAMWHRAYNLIWNQWFRDENLQDSLPVPIDDGPDDPSLYSLQRRGKRFDYFTSGNPFPQKGPAIELPLGETAPVLSDGGGVTFSIGGNAPYQLAGGGVDSNATWSSVPPAGAATWSDPGLYTDLSSATAATVNQLRQAFQIQKLLERDARGGTRYTEIIRAHFNVTSPDSRLQRPEYLGGSSSPININQIAQTQSSDTVTPQGNLAGIGTAVLDRHGFTRSFTEHCVILGFVSVRADLTYQQGLDRMWSRKTRYDFYWPALSHLGEQAILNKEIYAQGTAEDDDVFAYQERYAEYRYKPSKITGKFRSNDAGSLDAWHLSQDFATLPVLDSDFISENPPLDRVIAVNTEPHFIYDSYIKLRCARPMPVYSVPGLIDHF